MDHYSQSDVSLPADAPVFILNRIFEAPRPLVYQCWMDPTHLRRWWGPKSITCPVCEIDAHVGGAYRLVMRDAKGTDYPITGVFREIVPNERIVKTEDVSGHSQEWHDMVDPAHKGKGIRPIDLLTTVTFEDHPRGTKVTIQTRFPSQDLRDGFARVGMAEGWSSSLDKLEDLANALKGSDREINITRLISAPRDVVFRAFSDPKGLAVWWGPNGFTTTTRSLDFRVGGVWDYTMHGPDGTDYPNYVRYTAIEPNALIAHDHGADAAHPLMFRAVITFASEGAGTRVNLKLILNDARERPGYVGFGAVEGGYQNLERLDAWLEAQP
jgi:uncharacterized protein YndB with AHSA1/START domain